MNPPYTCLHLYRAQPSSASPPPSICCRIDSATTSAFDGQGSSISVLRAAGCAFDSAFVQGWALSLQESVIVIATLIFAAVCLSDCDPGMRRFSFDPLTAARPTLRSCHLCDDVYGDGGAAIRIPFRVHGKGRVIAVGWRSPSSCVGLGTWSSRFPPFPAPQELSLASAYVRAHHNA